MRWFFVRSGRVRPWLCFLALLILAPMLVSCYGSFPLTHLVYRFNGGVTHSDLIHTIVMWIFVIIPVYQVAILADVIVLNLVEFWTDGAIPVAEVQNPDGTTTALRPSEDGRGATLTVSKAGHVLMQVEFVRMGDGTCEARDTAGNRVGEVVPASDGQLLLKDARGEVVRVIAPRLPSGGQP